MSTPEKVMCIGIYLRQELSNESVKNKLKDYCMLWIDSESLDSLMQHFCF